MKFCSECGTALEDKYLEKEGMIPYCLHCGQFRFPTFNTAVSIIVLNETEDKTLLIKQYGKDDYILVAGYINKGESAEHAVCRELHEEVGMEVIKLSFNKSAYFAKTNTLMLNYSCKVNGETLRYDKDEVDYAQWLTLSEARKQIKQHSLAQEFLEYFCDYRFHTGVFAEERYIPK